MSIIYSIIQKSQLEGAKRLDAEYYQPEYLLNSSKLEKFGFETLQDLSISNITKGETPLWRGDSYLDTGIPFLRSENLIFASTDLSNIVFISEKVHERMKRSKILPNNVLLAIVGATIGHSGLVTDEYPEYNSNQAVAIVKPENEKYSCYLAIVLETKFCQLQIERLKGGGARDNLDLHEVRVLKIPKPDSEILNYCLEQIHKIRSLKKQSQIFYSQAENLLLEELGLKNFEEEDGLWSVVKLSEVKNVNRMDAEYFQPKYDKLISKINDRDSKTLENFVEEYSTGFPFKSENYQEQGVPLIRINNIRKGFIDLRDTAYLSEKDYLLSPKDTANSGDIVLSMSGTIGMTAIIPENITKCSINQRILRITPKDIDKNYLVLLLNSIIGSYQLERIGTGGVQTNISYKDIKNILIPILPKPTQQKIAELVKQSHEARKKSKKLLEEAKQKVEDLIENSGK